MTTRFTNFSLRQYSIIYTFHYLCSSGLRNYTTIVLANNFHKSRAESLCAFHQQHLLENCIYKPKCYSTRPSNKSTADLIILLGQDDSVIGIKTKTDAAELAKKKNMSLVRLENQTTYKKYPVYQLLRRARLIEAEGKVQQKEKFEEKRLTLSHKISNHDLQVKISNVEKWLKKNCHIKILVSGEIGKEQILEELYRKIESHFGSSARLLQKVVKNGNMKFTILPPKEKTL